MKKYFIIFISIFLYINCFAQHGDPSLLKVGYLYGNDIKTTIYNDGAFAGALNYDVRCKWKNHEYINSSTIVLGLELPLKDYNGDGIIDTIHSVIISRGPRNHQAEERSPIDNHFWGFNPLPGFADENYDSIAVSNNSSTWPTLWADHPDWGSNVWHGLNGPNNLTADMEAFYKMDDFADDEDQYRYGYIPNPTDSTIKGHGIEIAVRYLQFNHPFFKDILYTVYDIKNTSERTYDKIFLGKILSRLIGGYGDSGDDLGQFYTDYNSALEWDLDFKGIRNQKVGVIGESLFGSKDQPLKIGNFLFFNVSASPDMSNDSILWKKFTSGINAVAPIPQDGEYLFSSEFFSLNPGETRRIVYALAFDYSKDEDLQKLLNARAFYNSDFNIEQTINSIHFTNLNDYPELNGTIELTWDSDNTGSVDISFKKSPYDNWEKIADSVTNSGSFSWEKNIANDCSLGKLKIFKKDDLGNYLSFNESGYFTINNDFNNEGPVVKIISPDFDSVYTVKDKNYNLSILAGDPERSNLNCKIFYSQDNGFTYSLMEEHTLISDGLQKNFNLDFYAIPNSNEARIKVEVSDGEYTAVDSTWEFIKDVPRESDVIGHLKVISGKNDVDYQLNILDSSKVKPDDYLITFNDTSLTGQKYINIFDISKNQLIIDNKKYEPRFETFFDGISFSAKDFNTMNDTSRTNWNQNVSNNFEVQFYVIENNTYPSGNGYRMPSDYQIEFYNSIVDTSLADTIPPIRSSNIFYATPVFYKVKNLNNGNYIKTLYKKSGLITSNYSIIFKENISSSLVRTWRLVISSNTTSQPAFGDTLSIYTLKGFSRYDTLKVSNLFTGVNDRNNLPGKYILYQNYPNPFNPLTIISYQIPKEGFVTLKICDVLGKEVATLVSESKSTGRYKVNFNASNLASGVYLYQLKVNDFVATKKFVLLK